MRNGLSAVQIGTKGWKSARNPGANRGERSFAELGFSRGRRDLSRTMNKNLPGVKGFLD
jgi:hypothetical protein